MLFQQLAAMATSLSPHDHMTATDQELFRPGLCWWYNGPCTTSFFVHEKDEIYMKR